MSMFTVARQAALSSARLLQYTYSKFTSLSSIVIPCSSSHFVVVSLSFSCPFNVCRHFSSTKSDCIRESVTYGVAVGGVCAHVHSFLLRQQKVVAKSASRDGWNRQKWREMLGMISTPIPSPHHSLVQPHSSELIYQCLVLYTRRASPRPAARHTAQDRTMKTLKLHNVHCTKERRLLWGWRLFIRRVAKMWNSCLPT
jgi:hypothetical protein